jgi:hypothetical protein
VKKVLPEFLSKIDAIQSEMINEGNMKSSISDE